MLRARLDPSLHARVVARRSLLYEEGADPADDRPAHVRAGSSLAWLAGRLCVIQDDASFLAILDGPSGAVRALALARGEGGARQFDDGRGNRKHKLDLEACAVLGGDRLVAFGSGSTDRRETLVEVRATGERRALSARSLYAMLRARTDFSGSELNVEGAVAIGRSLLLLQRGNGAPRGALTPTNATARLDAEAFCTYLDEGASGPPPPLERVRRWDLGALRGEGGAPARLTFTDAARVAGDVVLYLAAAEASPVAVADGPVVGVALGMLSEEDPRYALLEDEVGRPLLDKLEGLAVDQASPDRLYAVVDRDDPAAPAELLTLVLGGCWR